jgi:hypothetical protein
MDSAANRGFDCHEVLGVAPGASPLEIRRAFYRLALQYHPDRNPDDEEAAEKFRLILEAYKTLTGRTGRNRGAGLGASNGNGFDPFRAWSAGASAQPAGAEPCCPECAAVGMGNIVCRKGGDLSAGKKRFVPSPFAVVFCSECGHIYAVFNTGV